MSSVDCFDPDTNTWSQVANMNIARHGHSLVILNGKLYAIGGLGVDSVEVYDPDNNTWTLLQHKLPGGVVGTGAGLIKKCQLVSINSPGTSVVVVDDLVDLADDLDLTDDRIAIEGAQLLDPITLMSPTNKSPPRAQSVASSHIKTKSKPSCSICLETFKDLKKAGEDIVSTTCGHVFCYTCLSSSLSTNDKKCPVCRNMLPTKNHWHKIFI